MIFKVVKGADVIAQFNMDGTLWMIVGDLLQNKTEVETNVLVDITTDGVGLELWDELDERILLRGTLADLKKSFTRGERIRFKEGSMTMRMPYFDNKESERPRAVTPPKDTGARW